MNKRASKLLATVALSGAVMAGCSSHDPSSADNPESYGQVTGQLRVDAPGGTIGVTTEVDFELECDGDVLKTGTLPVPLDGSSISGHFGSVPPSNDCEIRLSTTLTLSADPFSVDCEGSSGTFNVSANTTVNVGNILIECNLDDSSGVAFTGDIVFVPQSLDSFFVGPTHILFDPLLPVPPVSLLIGEPLPDPEVDYTWSVDPVSAGELAGCDATPDNCQFLCEEEGTHTLRLTANFGTNTRFREVEVTCEITEGSVTVIGTVGPGGTVTTDNQEATAGTPVAVSVTLPGGGTVVIQSTSTTEPEPPGYSFLGRQVNITAPPGTSEAPLTLVFELHESLLPPGTDETNLELFKNGVPIPNCTDVLPDPIDPDPCVSVREADGDVVRITVLTSTASPWNFGVVDGSVEPPAPFTLQLLHFSDVDGGGTAALANVENFSALVSHFRAERPAQTLFVSSGDNYIPGPIYQASNDPSMASLLGTQGVGRGEIAMINALGLQASAVGNHELDGGPAEFASIVNASGAWGGAAFPYVSSNLNFSTESTLASLVTADGQEASTIPGRLAASAVVTVDGEQIGLVGAVTPGLASITSVGNIGVSPSSSDVEELAAVIQEAVDALTIEGINKIIVLSHMQQIAVEKALAPLLSDVDVIIAGGSNTLLANEGSALHLGDTIADEYPLLFTSPKDEPVLVVNTDGDYKYLGRLLVDFDDQGLILLDSVDPEESGAWASIDNVVELLDAEPIVAVANVAEGLRSVLSAKDGNVAGYTDVFLEGRRNFVRSEETNLGNLTADANLWYAQQADATTVLSLKNGGGIRAAIGAIIAPPGSTDPSEIQLLPPQANDYKDEGAISQLDMETSLAFNNLLSLVSVTAAELWDVMEHAVAAANPGATPGQFPQLGGLRFSFDPTATARTGGDTNLGGATTGQRIRNLWVMVGGTPDVIVAEGVLQGDPGRTFRMVTLNFIVSCVPPTTGSPSANCGDGYPFKGLTAPDRKDLPVDFLPAEYDPGELDFASSGSEQDALAEYLRAFHPDQLTAYAEAETPKSEDLRIVNLTAHDPDPLYICDAPPEWQNVVLNEIRTGPGLPRFVELYNKGAAPVDLSAWQFKDNSDTNVFTFPDGTTIAAGGFRVLTDNTTAPLTGEFQFSFALNTNDEARLFSPCGVLIDTHTWGSNVTVSRCPNGTGGFSSRAQTRGATNACP